MNSFQAGNAEQISTAIFYSVLRSLDKMAVILSQHYKDTPAVSTEPVNFLSMNTSVEAVDRMGEQTAGFKATIVDLTKSLAYVRKENGNFGNKNDKMSTEVNDLKRRLMKLEQKNDHLSRFPLIVT